MTEKESGDTPESSGVPRVKINPFNIENQRRLQLAGNLLPQIETVQSKLNTTQGSSCSTGVQVIEFVNQATFSQQKTTNKFGGNFKHLKEQVLLSVNAPSPNTEFQVSERPQEVWPFIESGRFDKTFDVVSKLGEGAYGCVYHVKHKLDSNNYALKKIQIHMEFNDSDQREDRK